EPFGRTNGDAAEGGDGEQAQAGIERRLASEAVEQRAIEELADREPDEITRDRQRDLRRRGAEIACDLRKRRQIHVDRERADGAERTQNEDDQEIRAGAVRHCKFQSGDFRSGKRRVDRGRVPYVVALKISAQANAGCLDKSVSVSRAPTGSIEVRI